MKHLNYLPFVVFFLAVWFWVYVLLGIHSTFQPAQEARSEAFFTNCDTLVLSIDSTERKSDTIRVHFEGKFDADYLTIDSAIKLFGEIIPVRSIIRADSRPKVTMYIYGGPVQQNGAGAPKQNISQPQKDY